MKKIVLGGIFFWCLCGLLLTVRAAELIYVDGAATHDGTADSFDSGTLVLTANESNAFDDYAAGDIVEFISGTANHQVAIIDVKTSGSEVTLDRDIGSVSDGDRFNCVAGAWAPSDPFHYINSAITFAAITDTVVVVAGSYGPSHNGETLPVQIITPIFLLSISGAGSTIIESTGATRTHCISVEQDNVKVSGFTCLGSQGSGLAGIYLNEVDNCLISENICGPSGSSGNANTNGILVDGSDGSVGNTITGNTCRYNTGSGILVQYASQSVISLNTVTHNTLCGISIEQGSEHNTVSQNTASSNSGAGIQIIGASGYPSRFNSVVRNTVLSGNSHGLEVNAQALNNRFYLNSFGGTIPVYSYEPITPTNIYRSPTPIFFTYNGNNKTGYLGNYYSDDDHNNDADGDGISSDAYTIVNRTTGGSNNADNYQLVSLPANYSVQAWWLYSYLSDSIVTDMVMDDMTRRYGTDVVYYEDYLDIYSGEYATRDRTFPAGEWTGQLYFTTPPASDDTFGIQFTSDYDDLTLVPSSPIVITGDGTSHALTFSSYVGESLTVYDGYYLIMRITNNSADTDFNLLTGGAFGYLSPPEGSPPLLVDLVSFQGYGFPDKVLLLWRTAAEIDNAGFEIRRRVPGGEWMVITPALMPGEGGATWGARYAYTDTMVEPGVTFEYQLLDYDFDGTVTAHPPVTVTIPDHRMMMK